jgi:excisionase family DNA binding protein
VIVLDVDDECRLQLRVALGELYRICRRDGLRMRPELARLHDQLAARSGQERPCVAPVVDVDEVGRMSPLVHDLAGVAARLGRSVRTVRRLVASGELPVVMIGGARRVREADLVDYVNQLPKEKPA